MIIERNVGKRLMHGLNAKGEKLPLAILSAENPDCIKLSAAENNARNKKLENFLRNGGYLYKKIKSYYGVSEDGTLPEHSFVILGISLGLAKELSGKYGQQSFIYRWTDNGMYTMYARNKAGKYVEVDEEEHMNFVPDSDDFYSASGDFRGNIPFTKFEVDEKFDAWTDKRKELYMEGCRMFDNKHTGSYYYGKRRQALYGMNESADELSEDEYKEREKDLIENILVKADALWNHLSEQNYWNLIKAGVKLWMFVDEGKTAPFEEEVEHVDEVYAEYYHEMWDSKKMTLNLLEIIDDGLGLSDVEFRKAVKKHFSLSSF